MPDMYAIATTLAARFAPAQVTPPAGQADIRTATADVPNKLPPLPCVLVFLGTGEYEYMPQKRDSTHDFTIRFYLDQVRPVDSRRATPALLKWTTVLADQLEGAAMLGGTVTSARITNYAAGQMSYGGTDYWGIELTARVIVNEPWTPVA